MIYNSILKTYQSKVSTKILKMCDTQNLLKIQALIDEHKETISDGEYLSMVNSLMDLWEFKQENKKKITTDETTRYIRFLESEMEEAENYFTISRHRINTLVKQLHEKEKKIDELEEKLKEKENK